jgi:hypothetical protein
MARRYQPLFLFPPSAPLSARSTSYYLGEDKWAFYFEFPQSLEEDQSLEIWLNNNIPVVAACSSFRQPLTEFVISDNARRVCTYLPEYQVGTINRKFERGSKKRIVLVIDCSGSMRGTPFQDACRNALAIYDSHVVEGDEFGVVLFSNQLYTPIAVQEVSESNSAVLRSVLGSVLGSIPFRGGGTSMFWHFRMSLALLPNTIRIAILGL